MNTQQAINMNSSQTFPVLTGIDPAMDVRRPIPLSAVLRVMEAQVMKNDPVRSRAFPLYATWLLERDVPMTILVAAEFWEDFLVQYCKELPRRTQQWAQSVNMPGLRSPVSLLLFAAQVIDLWMVPGLRHRMSGSLLGLVAFRGLQALTLAVGLAIVVPITLLIATIGLRVGSHVFSALQHAPALLGF